MRDPVTIKELSERCRPLVIILCCGYCICVILLVAALASATEITEMKGLHRSEFQSTSIINFGIMISLSFLATILCALFITATFIKSMWLSLPYLVLHGIILIYCCYHFIYSLVVPVDFHHARENTQLTFGYHMLYHGHAFSPFVSIIGISLLIFTSIPMWKFVNECRLIGNEAVAERRVVPAQQVQMAPLPSSNSRGKLPSSNSRGTLPSSNSRGTLHEGNAEADNRISEHKMHRHHDHNRLILIV